MSGEKPKNSTNDNNTTDNKDAKTDNQDAVGGDQTIEQLKQQIAKSEVEKARVEADLALKLAESPAARKLAELEQQKKLADAQKALAEAQTQTALASNIGTTKPGPYSGSVDLKDKAGTIESRLLAARAVRTAAGQIAAAVKDKAIKFYVFEADSFTGFQRLTAFRFQLKMIKQAYLAAGIEEKPKAEESLDVQRQMIGAAPAAVAITAGLEAFSNILGHLKTDYTAQGTELNLDNSLLTFSVAGALADKEVLLPSLHGSAGSEDTIDSFTEELHQYDQLRRRASKRADEISTEIETLEQQSEAKEEDDKRELLAEINEKKTSLKQLNDINQSYDDLLAAQVIADDQGAVPLSALLKEYAIDRLITANNDGAILLLKLEHCGGGYLLKKNLLTGLGAMPMWHMGGATVTFLLMQGSDGKVLAGDVIPVHGGFIRSDEVKHVLETDS